MAQLLAESLALCALGGAAGVGLAHLLVGAARPLLAETLPATADVALDPRVLAFAGAMVLGVSLLVGLLPALQTSSGSLNASLGHGTRGSSGSRATLRRAIVVGEVAVSLVLICGALLMFRSLLNLQNVGAGVRIDKVLTLSVELPAAAHPQAESVVRSTQALVDRIQAVPGVERAAAATSAPLDGLREGGVIVAPNLIEGARLEVGIKHVDEHYFRALDIPVLLGRDFDQHDRLGSPPVAIVNQPLAARLNVADPVGRTVGLSLSPYGTKRADLVQVRIVGVIRPERLDSLRDAEPPVAYVPMAQAPTRLITLIVRTRTGAASVVPTIRTAFRELDPTLPIGPVLTMRELNCSTYRRWIPPRSCSPARRSRWWACWRCSSRRVVPPASTRSRLCAMKDEQRRTSSLAPRERRRGERLRRDNALATPARCSPSNAVGLLARASSSPPSPSGSHPPCATFATPSAS